MELTPENLKYIMSLVKSQVEAGGVREPKRAKQSPTDETDEAGCADEQRDAQSEAQTAEPSASAGSASIAQNVEESKVECQPPVKRTLRDFFQRS